MPPTEPTGFDTLRLLLQPTLALMLNELRRP